MKTDIEKSRTACLDRVFEILFISTFRFLSMLIHVSLCHPWQRDANVSIHVVLSSDNSAVVPPDPIPNSEVKCSCADGSVGVPM